MNICSWSKRFLIVTFRCRNSCRRKLRNLCLFSMMSIIMIMAVNPNKSKARRSLILHLLLLVSPFIIVVHPLLIHLVKMLNQGDHLEESLSQLVVTLYNHDKILLQIPRELRRRGTRPRGPNVPKRMLNTENTHANIITMKKRISHIKSFRCCN